MTPKLRRLLRAVRRLERPVGARVLMTIGGMQFAVEGATCITNAEEWEEAFGRPAAPELFMGGKVSFTCSAPLTEERKAALGPFCGWESGTCEQCGKFAGRLNVQADGCRFGAWRWEGAKPIPPDIIGAKVCDQCGRLEMLNPEAIRARRAQHEGKTVG